jgi:hypothetical protein
VRNRLPDERVAIRHCDAILGRAFQTSQRIGQVCRINAASVPDKRGGLNRSTQHSAWTHAALNTKAKKRRLGQPGAARFVL